MRNQTSIIKSVAIKACIGFTLLEVLIVLFIVGISIGVVGLAISSSTESRLLVNEASKVSAWFEHIRHYAIINSKTYTIKIDASKEKLNVEEFKDSNWLKASIDSNVYRLQNNIKTQLLFNDEVLIELRIFPDASYTPFTLNLIIKNKVLYTLEGDGTNAPVLSSAEETS